MTKKITRRTFGKAAAVMAPIGLAALQTATSHARIIGANDRIRCGFIGTANRGRQLLDAFLQCKKDMEVAALCDIDSETLAKAKEKYAPNAITEHDFRKLIERSDLDALVYATPDQWHAYQTIETCKAGKDVYIEKPVSSTIKEGRMMIQAAEKYKRVVQVGIHRRSSPLYKKIADENIDQKIGRVAAARTGYTSNMYPNGMGKAKPGNPPANLDWDLWIGPKPFQPYQENIAPYKFRWWINYCSQIANQGVHHIDAIRWLLHEKAPDSVCAMGGKYVVDDDRTIPDTMEAVFTFASGRLLTFSFFESSGNPFMATNENNSALGYIEFRGTQGTLYAFDNRYIIKPERGGQFQDRQLRMKEEVYQIDGRAEGNKDLTAVHAQNFLDCMRSRKPTNCSLEDAQRSTSISLMANISLAVGRRLNWDAVKEEFIGDDEANSYLFYEYRNPWKLVI